ncbi:YafY family protein [uncultured Thalassolituus sp.]|uniref:helix-turn-helix transcriptional regulator n=1 Tax=uncultured Thalassolituus sp. TaxID=285273 RepID=UPI0027D936AB|nr:YafY family protein [uncultured Thalassolituus sp.]
MSESGSGIVRTYRLFQLLDELRLHRTAVPARELATRMNVSLRTLYRDMADLQAMGAPIRGEGGIGYILEPGYFMPSLRLSESELSAIALGLRLVASRSDQGVAGSARNAAAKIASVVGEAARYEFLNSSFMAGPSKLDNTPYLRELKDAIQLRKELEIEYLSLADKHTRRLARPLGLTVFDTAWLLTLWCERAQSFRHFRVDRIQSLRSTGRHFSDEHGKRFSDFLENEGHQDNFLDPEGA